jgi:ParB-like chromosome segregation protein Spo0J
VVKANAMSVKRDMAVVWRSVDDLSPHPNNPRTHSDEQLEQLFASISRFGWTVPLIVDEDLTILAGHGRLEMAERNGIKKVPTIQVTGLTNEEKRAYLIADNRLSENADWDIPQLLAEIDFLSEHAIEADTLGFSDADILSYHSAIDDTGFVEPVAPPSAPALSSPPESGQRERIESSTDPTQLQSDPRTQSEVAATLVPFSLMLPTDDRERAYAVLDRARGDSLTMAEALMVVIDAFDADQQESESEQE